MISFEPTEEQSAIQREVRRFAEELRGAARAADDARAVPPELGATYRGLGLAGLELPEAVGGAGLDLVTRVLVEEELAWGSAGLAIGLGSGPATYAVLELGDDATQQRWVPTFANGITALAISERDLGAELSAGDVRAERISGGYRITGAKLFVLNADQAERLVVFARVDEAPGVLGMRAFVIEANAGGLRIGPEDDRLGIRAVRSFAVQFDRVEVGDDALIGRFAEPYAPAAFDRFVARTWLTNAARQVGVGRAAVEYAVKYAQERSAFGRPIGSFQGVAFKIADIAMDVESARGLVLRAAVAVDQRHDDLLRLGALATVHANEAAVRATIDAVQVLGGAGFMQDYPVEMWMRDARTIAQLYGTDALRNHIAGERCYGPQGDSGAIDPAAAFAAFGAAFSQ